MPEEQNLRAFNNGELGPELYGRVDLEKYHTSLKTSFNAIPQKFGGVKSRNGTEFVARLPDSFDVVDIQDFGNLFVVYFNLDGVVHGAFFGKDGTLPGDKYRIFIRNGSITAGSEIAGDVLREEVEESDVFYFIGTAYENRAKADSGGIEARNQSFVKFTYDTNSKTYNTDFRHRKDGANLNDYHIVGKILKLFRAGSRPLNFRLRDDFGNLYFGGEKLLRFDTELDSREVKTYEYDYTYSFQTEINSLHARKPRDGRDGASADSYKYVSSLVDDFGRERIVVDRIQIKSGSTNTSLKIRLRVYEQFQRYNQHDSRAVANKPNSRGQYIFTPGLIYPIEYGGERVWVRITSYAADTAQGTDEWDAILGIEPADEDVTIALPSSLTNAHILTPITDGFYLDNAAPVNAPLSERTRLLPPIPTADSPMILSISKTNASDPYLPSYYRVYKRSGSGDFRLLLASASGEGMRDTGQLEDVSETFTIPRSNSLDLIDPKGGTEAGQRFVIHDDERVLVSRLGDVTDFAIPNVPTDSGPFIFRPALRDGEFLNFVFQTRDLLIGTNQREILLGENGVITPTAINARTIGNEGSAGGIDPTVVKNAVAFVHSNRKSIILMGYDREAGGQIAVDLTKYHPNIFASEEIKEMVLIKGTSYILFVLAGGKIFTCTVDLGERVQAWARHDFGGEVISIAKEYQRESFYMVIKRNGLTNVERYAEDNLYGLDSYTGDSEVFEGSDLKLSVVSQDGGYVYRSIEDGNTATQDELTDEDKQSNRIFGIGYEARIGTLPIETASKETYFQELVNVNRLVVYTLGTKGFHILEPDGSVSDHTYRITESTNMNDPLQDKNTPQLIPVEGEWGRGEVVILQRRPIPFHILSITPQGEFGDE